MSAKSDLFTRLQYLNAAIPLPPLIDVGIAISEHNGVANLLRKGLGIVAFNILEDFIKNKSAEALDSLSTSLLPFGHLTDTLQDAAISGALNALSSKSSTNKRDGNDWKTIIQQETLKIHSTQNPTYQLSKYSLMNSGSNVTASEVSDFLRAFGLSGGWTLLKNVSDNIGGGLPDLGQAYQNASQRRHNAAHAANFQYNYLWLSNIKNEILAICASLDILITAKCRQVVREPAKIMSDHDINTELNYRFLEPGGGTIYRETSVIGGRSRKNWPSLANALAHLRPQLGTRKEFLVILNLSKRIEDWYS